MLRRCDLALHEAEQRGTGSVAFFDKTMEKAIDRRGIIESSLDQAIRGGRIGPHFQPLIELADGSVAGFEVLARWSHPVIGEIPPSAFIPIVTESGRLEETTLAILDRSCRAAREWPGAFRLAINVSPKSLNDERFLNDFLAVIKGAGFRPDRIEVEITEDAFVQDAFLLSKPIARLKSEGLSLAIDDFGAGYSSLRRLLLLPFDKIKIDQSFVADMIDNPESRKIVEAIIGLGRSMGLMTVAEGVEREDQLAAVRGLDCKVGQGFIFAKALPAEQAPGYMRAQRPTITARPRLERLAIAS
jgi:predicted signal transduction protein with EAL and GGDEF domain